MFIKLLRDLHLVLVIKILMPTAENIEKFIYFFSARRANFFSAAGKILDLVSVIRKAKKWAQNRNSNEIFSCIDDIARWMWKIVVMESSGTYGNIIKTFASGLFQVQSLCTHWMKHCECLQNSWQTPSHPLFLKKLVGREGKCSYDNASTDNKPLLSWYEMFPILEYIEGGPLFRTPIKFQDYCQYANK